MTYTLYGSKTSPFVRRLRVLMEHLPYDFKEMDIYGPDAKLLNTINPINQIPVLIDGDLKIWDSRVIFNYLNLIHRFQNMDWEDENLLSSIDGAMDSAVSLFLMRRSGININEPTMYVTRQKERIESILDYLKTQMDGPTLKEWNFHSISLYCFLDWAKTRELIDLSQRPECQALLAAHADKPAIKSTQIPKG